MSNYIEQSASVAPAEPAPKVYRATVHGGSDLDVSPSVAVFQVDVQLAHDIIKFASLVKANDVYKIERFDYRAEFFQFDPETAPEDAEEAGDENAVRTDCDCLVVTDSEFFFRAFVKHTDVGVECSGQSVSELAKHFGLQFGEQELVNDDEEVVVKLADGCTLRSGVYDPRKEGALTSGEYVRLCGPEGEEILYWDQEEWANDPALVMGAIMNSAAGLRVQRVAAPSLGM